MQAIRVHVSHINDRLVETDYRVRNDRNGYRVIKEKSRWSQTRQRCLVPAGLGSNKNRR